MIKRIKYWYLTRVKYRKEYNDLLDALDTGSLPYAWEAEEVSARHRDVANKIILLLGEDFYFQEISNSNVRRVKANKVYSNPWSSHNVEIQKRKIDPTNRNRIDVSKNDRLFLLELNSKTLEFYIHLRKKK